MAERKKPSACEPVPVEGRFAYDGLDRVIHERARLSILTSLATHTAGLSFNDLKDTCRLTDGNLARHLQVLQEARLVEVSRATFGRRPQTTCRLSQFGRQKFVEYIEVLQSVVADAVAAGSPGESRQPAQHASPAGQAIRKRLAWRG